MAVMEVRVPDIGDFKDVAVIELLVKPGDTVAVDQSLITVESDKASMEIPSSHAGVVQSLVVKLGDTVNMGSVLLMLEASGAAGAPAPAPAPAPAAPAEPPAAAPAVVAAPAEGHTGRALTRHHTDHQRLLKLVVLGAHRAGLSSDGDAGFFELQGHGQRIGAPCPLNRLGQSFDHQLHAHMHIVFRGLGKPLAKRLDKPI